jgi:hypothetical protein
LGEGPDAVLAEGWDGLTNLALLLLVYICGAPACTKALAQALRRAWPRVLAGFWPKVGTALAIWPSYCWITSVGLVQGMGKGPGAVLAGRSDGCLCLVNPQEKSLHCLLESPQCPAAEMECLAATDVVVVTGLRDGALRVVRMDTPLTG